MQVIAAAIILLFFYYAAGVVITLLLSILLAYFLDPAVEFLERMNLPRTLGAMIMVLILIAVLVAVCYALWTRTADCAGARRLIHNNSASGNRHRSNAVLSRYWLVVRAVSGSYVHALSGFFYACGKARSLARDVATFPCLPAHASERNFGGSAGCPARLPRGNDRRDAGGDFREQPVLLDDGSGLSDFDGNCLRFAEHGALYGRGASVAARFYHCTSEVEDRGAVCFDCGDA